MKFFFLVAAVLAFSSMSARAYELDEVFVEPKEPVVVEEKPIKKETPKPAKQVAKKVVKKPAPKPAPKPQPAPTPAPTGTCADWMRAAGVTDMGNAAELIRRESGCNPNAVNPSSGACGIGQQLPCGKWPHTWNDPVGAIIDMQNYVMGRYGSWAAAVAWHNANNWY